MGKSRKSLTKESRRVLSGQRSQKLQALQRGGDGSGMRLGGGAGSKEAGGTLPEVQDDWWTRMRGGEVLGEELTGPPNRERADWAARKELDQSWALIGRGGPWRRGQRAPEGGRGSRAGLPASRSGYERGGSPSQLGPGRALGSAALPPGVSGQEERRSDAAAGSGLGEQGGVVEARCAAAASPPGAQGPGRAGLRGARTMRADCRPPRWRAGRC